MSHYCKQYDEIYTTGSEKAKWIQKYSLCNVTNVILDKKSALKFNGLCVGVKNIEHKNSTCALSRAYRVSELVSSV